MEKLKVGICGWGNVATGLFNLIENDQRIRQAIRGIKNFLSMEI